MKKPSFIVAATMAAMLCSPAVADSVEALTGHWETDTANCSEPATEGYGLFFDGSNAFEWVNHATEGGACQIDAGSVTCAAEEGEPSQAKVSFRVAGDTLFAIGPWQDAETAYASCDMAVLDLMP